MILIKVTATVSKSVENRKHNPHKMFSIVRNTHISITSLFYNVCNSKNYTDPKYCENLNREILKMGQKRKEITLIINPIQNKSVYLSVESTKAFVIIRSPFYQFLLYKKESL